VIEVDYSVHLNLPAGRLAAIVSYSGEHYKGWQIQQNNVPTVQGALETALSKVANHSVRTVCAGRTDAGVHSTFQVVHFDVKVERTFYSWVMGVNSQLPRDITIQWIGSTQIDFSARFSAFYRRYFYIIYNHPVRPSIQHQGVSWYIPTLDESRMHESSQVLVGEHDFSSYRAAGCQSKSPFRNLHSIRVFRQSYYVIIDIKANAFLHHMVRNIAGVLLSVGSGESGIEWPEEVLLLKDRSLGGVTAKAGGLYLVDVGYPEVFGIPKGKPEFPFITF